MPKGQVQTARAAARVGERSGSLVIIEFMGSNKNRHAIFKCQCDCGNVVERNSMLFRVTGSCGCKTKDKQRAMNLKHGHRPRSGASSIYQTWSAMKRRCMNKGNSDYKWYGGKGVTVCDRWMTFEGFVSDMGDSHFEGATIDRVDSTGNYEPSNCRWVTGAENARMAAKQRWEKMTEEESCFWRKQVVAIGVESRLKAEKRRGREL